MTDLVTIGFKADAKGIDQVNKGFDNVVASGGRADQTIRQTEKTVTKFSGAAAKGSDKMAMFGRQSGQAGIQLQQFIGQVQGGQSAMLALSQQSADLGFVLGAPLVGAIVGISASIAGLLLPNLLNAEKASSKLEKSMKAVNRVATESGGIVEYSDYIKELAQQSEKAARLMLIATEQNAKMAGKAAAEAIGEEFNDAFDVTTFQASFEALKNIAGTAQGTGYTISKEYEDLGKQFGLTGKDARQAGIDILVSLREMEMAVSTAAPDSREKIVAFQESLLKLTETATGKNKDKLIGFVTAISEYLEKADSAAKLSDDVKQSLKSFGDSLQPDKAVEFAKSVGAISESLKAQIIALEAQKIALKDGEKAALEYEIIQRLGLKTVEQIPEALKAEVKQYIKLTKEKQKARKEEARLLTEQRKANAEQERSKRSLEQLQTALTNQEQQLLLTADAYEIYRIKQDAAINGYDPAPLLERIRMIQLLRKETEFQQHMDDNFIKSFQDAEVAVEDFTGVSEKAAERIEEVFADAWLNMFDGFDSVVDGMKNAFKRMLAEMAHEAFTKNILVNVGVGGQGAAGGAGGLSKVFSGGNFNDMAGIMSMATTIGAGMALNDALAPLLGTEGKYQSLGFLPSAIMGGNWETNKRELQVGVSGSDFSGGVFSEDKKKKLWKNRYRSSFEQIADAAFDSIFSSVTSSLSDAAALLDITEVTKTFSTSGFGGKFGMVEDSIYQTLETTITKPVDQWLAEFNRSSNIDIKGLSEEEVEQKLQDWIAQTTDAMIDGVFGQMLDGLKKEGESSADALDRVVGSFNLVNKMSELMNVNFDAVGEAGAIAATTISELAGGLESLTQLSNSYYQNFFSDEEKFLNLQEELTKAFAEMGVPLTTTKDGFRQLVESLDLTNEADQEMFATLMKLNPLMAQYISSLENQEMTLKAIAQANVEDALSNLEKAIEADNKRINLILDGAKDAYKAEVERINGVRDALNDSFSALSGNLDDAKSAMTSAFAGQKAAIIDASNMRIDGIRQEIDASREYHQAELEFLSAQKSAVSDMISGLTGASGNLRGFAGVDTAALSNDLAKALASARAGNFNPAMQLGDISALRGDASQFESAAQMRVQQGAVGFRANELANLVDNQLTIEEKTLAALEQQTIAETLRFNEEQATLSDRIAKEQELAEMQVKALDAQLNNLLGINDGVLSVDASIIAFQKAQDELNALDYERQLEILAEQEEWAMEALDQAESNHQQVLQVNESILNSAQAQINAVYNVNASVLSVTEAVRQLQITVQNAEAAQANRDLQIAKQTRKSADSLQQIVIDGVQTEAIA